jgi:hypothetical protein
MRNDMSKVITECYRHKSYFRGIDTKTERRRVRQKLQEATHYEEEYLDEALEEEVAIKSKAPIKNGRYFEFGENLSPLKNYIQSSLGKSYDEVYSEMKAAIPDGTMGDHVLQHFGHYFDHNMRLDDEGYLIHPNGSYAKKSSRRYAFNFYYLESDKIVRNYMNDEHKIKVGRYEGYMRNNSILILSNDGKTIGKYDKMLTPREEDPNSRDIHNMYGVMKFELYCSNEFTQKNLIQINHIDSHFDSGFYLVVFRPYFGHEKIAQYEVYHFSKDDYFSGESRYTNMISFRTDFSSGLYDLPFILESKRTRGWVRYFVKIRHVDKSEYVNEKNKKFLEEIKTAQEKLREERRQRNAELKRIKRKYDKAKHYDEVLRLANAKKKIIKAHEKEKAKTKKRKRKNQDKRKISRPSTTTPQPKRKSWLSEK